MSKWYQKDKTEKILCKCGCGTKILKWQKNLKERFYAFNHQPRSKPDSYRLHHRELWLGQKNPMWKGGVNVKKRNLGKRTYPRFYEKQRKIVLLKNPSCNKCSKKAVNVHHIDGNTYNNELKNLEALCRSCHNKVHLKF